MRKLSHAVGLGVAALLLGCQGELVTEPSSIAPAFSIVANANGSYFVGKGDVQTFAGWNNTVVQKNANYVDFQLNSSTTTSWTCTKTFFTGPDDTEHVIVQQRQTSTTTQGFFTTQGRNISEGLNGPNTGFNLTPDGAPTTVTSGPAIGSCPATPSGFVYDDNATTVSDGGTGLQIILTTGAPGPFLTPTGKAVNTWYNFP